MTKNFELHVTDQKMFFTAFSFAPIGMALLDQFGSFIRVNSSFCDFIGYEEDDLLQINFKDITHAEDLLSDKEQNQKLMNGEIPSYHIEKRYIHKNGHLKWGHLTVSFLSVAGESVTISQIVDITEKKQSQTEIKRLQSLYNLSSESIGISDLEGIFIQAEKLSLTGQLSASIAHEIRNPITAIKGFIKLLQTAEGKQLYYDILESEIDRIERILSEFLTLAKPQKRIVKQVNLVDMLEQVIYLLQAEANLKGIEVIKHINADTAEIVCDENQIKQVFINIMKNAFEAMPERGSLKIELNTLQDNKIQQIRITDTGCGIPAEILAKIGKPFFTTKEKGTGLGFLVSKNIIESHDGQIFISSEEQKGTSIEVRLPLIANPTHSFICYD